MSVHGGDTVDMVRRAGVAQSRRAAVVRSLALAMLGVMLTAVVAASGTAARAAVDGAAWQQLGPADARLAGLSAPRSGALFAYSTRELWRSDDAGATWRPVPLPAEPRSIVVDPHDHTTVYVGAAVDDGGIFRNHVFRTRDEGATWQVILPVPGSEVESAGIIASPATPGLLYSRQGAGFLRRSDDGGDTWIDLQTPALPRPGPQTPCTDLFELFPHPTNPEIVYQVGKCGVQRAHDVGSDPAYRTERSTDRGQSWSTLDPSPFLSASARLAGCGPNAPHRLYLADRPPDFLTGPSNAPALVSRSDDGGETWLRVRRGEDGADERIGGIACDPTNPDRVYIRRTGGRGGLRASADGGQTWTELPLPEGVRDSDLAVGIDGRYLFLATDKGVWRLALAD